MSSIWHIITPEYPPQLGGLGDHTQLLALGLARIGEQVKVWAPSGADTESFRDHFQVSTELGKFGLFDLWKAGKALNKYPRPRQIFLQWVPHGYGMRALNVPFCLWIWVRSAFRGDQTQILVHEPYLSYKRGSMRQNIAAWIQRRMTTIVLQTTGRIWITIPAWEELLKPYAKGRNPKFRWLPATATIQSHRDKSGVEEIRRRYCTSKYLIGHFGTHGSAVTKLLDQILPRLLSERDDISILLIGNGSHDFFTSFAQNHPSWADRVRATGALSNVDISTHLQACNLVIQPFPDGISSRRSTAMSALAHGIPMITTSGELTEEFWDTCGAVRIASVEDPQAFVSATSSVLDDENAQITMSQIGLTVYAQRFEIGKLVQNLVSRSNE